MEQWLFLDRRNHTTGDFGVDQAMELSTIIHPGITISQLSVFDQAPSLADVTPNRSVRESIVEHCFLGPACHGHLTNTNQESVLAFFGSVALSYCFQANSLLRKRSST